MVRPSHNYFNPHTREGCDKIIELDMDGIIYFNPHTREGCDSRLTLPVSARHHFNPHTREGCDAAAISVSSIAS